LAGAESALAGGFFDRRLRDGELLASRGEKLGNVFDGVVGFGRSRGLLTVGLNRAALPACALVFVFVGIVSVGCVVGCGASPRRAAGGGRPT